MAVTITEHHEHLIDYGDNHRLERHARSEEDGSYLWAVYSRENDVWLPQFRGPHHKAVEFLRNLLGE